ncbi:MAG: hypothetical protein V9F46_11700 [Chitinophagaceae bacterium]
MRSAVTSRSNWAKESRMFSVSRPIEVVVLNDCVTETKVTPLRSNTSTSLAKSISERREAVDLVDDHHVDQPVLDVGQQPLQAGALQRAAGDAAVVVLIADQHPALGALAGDVGLAGLALGIERVELLLQPFLGGFPGVDGAAQLADEGFGGAFPRWFFSPKKTQPFQRVPVMARAMADSDL